MKVQFKLSLLVSLFFFSIHSSFAILEYDMNDTLYAWAPSGLNLRAAPNSQSKVMAKIYFGDNVVVKDNKNAEDYLCDSSSIADKIQVTKTKVNLLTLNGRWVTVIYNGRIGYVFDAYLSKLMPNSMQEGERSLFDFFAAKTDINYLIQKDSLIEFGEDKIVFSNGAYMKRYYYPKGYSYKMVIPDFSEEEAFLLIRYLDDQATGILRKKEEGILINQKESGYRIVQFDNMVMITWS